MKAGARVALGVAAGYFLGRTKKMRLALMIAAAGATGRTGATPGKLVQGGLKQLGSAAEVGKLTELARDELLSAAKSAAITAASSRIESLNERLQDGGGKQDKDSGEEAEAEPHTEDETENEEEKPPPRRRRASSKSQGESPRRAPVRRARR